MTEKSELVKQQQGLRLKEVRDACNYTQAEMAKILGYKHTSSYNQLEKGRNLIRGNILYMLKKELNVNTKFVTEGKGNMFLSKGNVSETSLERELERCLKENARLNDIIDALTRKSNP